MSCPGTSMSNQSQSNILINSTGRHKKRRLCLHPKNAASVVRLWVFRYQSSLAWTPCRWESVPSIWCSSVGRREYSCWIIWEDEHLRWAADVGRAPRVESKEERRCIKEKIESEFVYEKYQYEMIYDILSTCWGEYQKKTNLDFSLDGRSSEIVYVCIRY